MDIFVKLILIASALSFLVILLPIKLDFFHQKIFPIAFCIFFPGLIYSLVIFSPLLILMFLPFLAGSFLSIIPNYSILFIGYIILIILGKHGSDLENKKIEGLTGDERERMLDSWECEVIRQRTLKTGLTILIINIVLSYIFK